MRKIYSPVGKVTLLFSSCFVCTFITGFVFENEKYTALLLVCLFSLVGYFFGVMFHECGHVVGARIARFKVLRVIIGPLMVIQNPKGKMEYRPNMEVTSGPGSVVAIPDTFENLRQRYIRVVVGGPLASLGCGIVFTLLSVLTAIIWLGNSSSRIAISNYHEWWLSALFGFIGLASLILFVVNIIPRQTRFAESDGYRLRNLWRDDAKGEREAQLLVIVSSLVRVRRPKNFLTSAIKSMLILNDNSREEGLAHYFAYLKYLDSEDIESAETHLIRLTELFHKIDWKTQCEIAYWIAFHAAFYKRDEGTAREWFAQAKMRHSEPTIVAYIAGATLGFLEGHHRGALEDANQFATLLNDQRLMGWEVALFYKQVMEGVTRRYINAIRPILAEVQ